MAKKTKSGRDRLAAEAGRIEGIKSNSEKPMGVGSEIVDIAPARGAVRRFQPKEAQITEAGNIRVTRVGYKGHDALQIADAFDLMQLQASRRNKAVGPLFSAGQISAGRDYAALYEKVQSAGVKCSSVEALGGGGQGSFIDAVLRDSRRLADLQRCIGSDVVLRPKRARPSQDATRRPIKASDVVREICVGGRTVSQLLQKFGWSRSPAFTKQITGALQDALDRMQGFS